MLYVCPGCKYSRPSASADWTYFCTVVIDLLAFVSFVFPSVFVSRANVKLEAQNYRAGESIEQRQFIEKGKVLNEKADEVRCCHFFHRQ